MANKKSYQESEDIIADIDEAIYDQAVDGNVDAQKLLLQVHQDQAVDAKIKEMFFPDTTCE